MTRGRSSPQTERSRSEEHTSELQSLAYLVCRLLLEKKNCLLHVTGQARPSIDCRKNALRRGRSARRAVSRDRQARKTRMERKTLHGASFFYECAALRDPNSLPKRRSSA